MGSEDFDVRPALEFDVSKSEQGGREETSMRKVQIRKSFGLSLWTGNHHIGSKIGATRLFII
jgi:hypothetical protein